MTLQEPLISVIVPVYKVEEYIHKCVDSILNQTYKNLEIILVDDGSPDRCPEICDEYAAMDARVKVIHKENGGLSDARNAALDICKGSYVTFVDSDDWIDLQCVELLYNTLKKYQADIAITNPIFVYQSPYIEKIRLEFTKPEGAFNRLEALESMLYQEQFDTSACGKLYKVHLFKHIKFPKGMLFEDLATTYQLIHLSDKISYINKPMYYYLQRENSIITAPFHAKKMHLINICDEMLKFMKKNYPQLKKAAICRLMSANFHVYLQIPSREKQKYEAEIKRITHNIHKYRGVVIADPKARMKTKIATMVSLFGIKTVKLCNNIIQRI